MTHNIETAAMPNLSCPHCDSELLDVMPGSYGHGKPYYEVICLDCGAEGPHGDTPEEACRLWDAKHSRHRIGERNAKSVCADVTEGAAAPVILTAAEQHRERQRKQGLFSLACGLLQPGA